MDWSPIERIHDLRNQVQHRYVLISQVQAHQVVDDAIICANLITSDILKLLWTEISISELFEDNLTRNLYQNAEKAYTCGNNDDAIIYLIAAFEYARNKEQIRSAGSMITLDKMIAEGFPRTADNDIQHLKILKYVKKIHDEVEILKLGLIYKEYRWYSDIAPFLITPTFENNLRPKDFDEDKPDEENLLLFYNYWKGEMSEQLKWLRDSKPDNNYPVELKKNWLPFAFRFVEKSILSWQSVKRKTPEIIINDLISFIEKYPHENNQLIESDEQLLEKKDILP